MSLATLLPLALQASIFLTVLALGLRADRSDLTYVLRRPGLFVRSMLAMMVLMPIIAILLVRTMSLTHVVGVALIALSLSPVPPMLPGKQVKAGGRHAYAVGLLVTASLVSIIWIPIAMELIDPLSPANLSAEPLGIAPVLLITVLLPLALGFIIRSVSRDLAEKVQPYVSAFATVMLVAAVLPLIVAMWPAIASHIGNGTLLAIALFVIAGLVIGHLLGGPDPEDRTVLAFASASRHPGVAIALAQMNFPNEPSIAPAVLLYLLAAAVFSLPYNLWRKRSIKDAAEAESSRARPI